MIKIYYVPGFRKTREYMLIKQGLERNPRVKLVDKAEKSDFVFQFYYVKRHEEHYTERFPAEKTVVIDYHDNANWLSSVPCFAYFKRSNVQKVDRGNYVTKERIKRSSKFHPISFAIMDEFISNPHPRITGNVERDLVLSCTLRKTRRPHFNRVRVLDFLTQLNIQGKKQIGNYTRGTMKRFNAPDMREYFRLLRRSRIVVTCNPDKWEGDHRLWEAFANGALVFVDKMYAPMKNKPINGTHCFYYELTNRGLRNLRKKLFYYMEHVAEAERIAKIGHDFAMQYHRPSNRIDEILDVIT